MSNTKKANEILNSSGVTFGTSGARGLVKQFTPEVCAAFTVAFLDVLKRNFNFETIALAIDNRPSSELMVKACASAAKQAGIKVVYYGVVPTPALALTSMKHQVPSIMVTGSHIPFDRNGLKFYRPDGEITKQDELSILASEASVREEPLSLELEINSEASKNYVDRNTFIFDGLPLSKMRIGVYEHSSSGRDLYPLILSKLGAKVISLERSDTFVPVDTEAVGEEERRKAKVWSTKYKLDAIFTTDGDGDRPMLADENGDWLRGDILGLLCAKAIEIEAVAIPISCNSSVSESGTFSHASYTQIGSPYVIAEIEKLKKRYSRVAGFEANGGFILGSDVSMSRSRLDALPTRDAVLPAIAVLAKSAELDKKISQLVEELPDRYTASDRIQNFEHNRSKELLALGHVRPDELVASWQLGLSGIKRVDHTDGLRIYFDNDDIVHIRPSGNAPELRCYSESCTQERADWLVRNVLYALVN
ncbi:phosphomannomutase [Vibrio coralliilyticus]|uniref:phosphomannomutase n=1 Tax=Vibrio coralliilyticus TaxID=190893 RepID=UPI00148C447F|nr:phosphomannomutase [Vibrio coralliilyticus]NOI30690.1 phosphomannomutase [Vibrio coralliilyticus]NOI49762.1 phosphomannomutase [Vibrio coralliilyticus]